MFSVAAAAVEPSARGGFSVVSTVNDRVCDSPHTHLAVYRSMDAAEMYANAASMVSSHDPRCVLRKMAQRKKHEAQSLKRRYCADDAPFQQSERRGSSPSMTKYLLDVGFRPIETLEQAVDFLLRKEYETLGLYTGLANAEEDHRVRRLLHHLIKCQRKHIAFVQSCSSLERSAPCWTKHLERPS
jgi:rubrerythrin